MQTLKNIQNNSASMNIITLLKATYDIWYRGASTHFHGLQDWI